MHHLRLRYYQHHKQHPCQKSAGHPRPFKLLASSKFQFYPSSSKWLAACQNVTLLQQAHPFLTPIMAGIMDLHKKCMNENYHSQSLVVPTSISLMDLLFRQVPLHIDKGPPP